MPEETGECGAGREAFHPEQWSGLESTEHSCEETWKVPQWNEAKPEETVQRDAGREGAESNPVEAAADPSQPFFPTALDKRRDLTIPGRTVDVQTIVVMRAAWPHDDSIEVFAKLQNTSFVFRSQSKN